MGAGAGFCMDDIVVKKVHVRYLISWWVLVLNPNSFLQSSSDRCRIAQRLSDYRLGQTPTGLFTAGVVNR